MLGRFKWIRVSCRITKSDDVKYVEKTIIERTSSRVKLNNQPFENIGTLNIYIDGVRMIEGLTMN